MRYPQYANTERWIVGFQDLGERENGEILLNGCAVFFSSDGSTLEPDRGGGFTILYMY